jgi:hypothetical protein
MSYTAALMNWSLAPSVRLRGPSSAGVMVRGRAIFVDIVSSRRVAARSADLAIRTLRSNFRACALNMIGLVASALVVLFSSFALFLLVAGFAAVSALHG